jgi:galactokinase
MSRAEREITAPGRVNLIGEHIDYLHRDVLPVAIDRAVRLRFTPRGDRHIHATAEGAYEPRCFEWSDAMEPYSEGDWGNYIKAAALGVAKRWGVHRGIDCHAGGNLPPAAGLSSSSALVVAATLALLRANRIEAAFEELMEVLPEAEQYVGTRGGGMDHAACLAGRRGHALRISFDPVRVEPVPIPQSWALFIVHTGRTAEKSSRLRDEFNLRRSLSASAAAKTSRGESLTEHEQRCWRHASSETGRVTAAVEALRSADLARFGELLFESHASLRDDLRVSCPEADAIVASCRAAGVAGARITGAGFGGFVVAVCQAATLPAVLQDLRRQSQGANCHSPQLIPVTASDGALRMMTQSTPSRSLME